jgi:hypothetical protein
LKRRGISFTERNPVLADTFRTNAIWCGKGTPASAIKELAIALMDGGIPVQYIGRIPSESTNVLYVLSHIAMPDRVLTSQPLSRAQIDAIKGCPTTVDDFIANFKRFQNPQIKR